MVRHKIAVFHPFLRAPSPRKPHAEKTGRDQPDPSHRALHCNQAGEQDEIDPFRDLEIIENQAVPEPGAGNALERLQELTREIEEELRELRNRVR